MKKSGEDVEGVRKRRLGDRDIKTEDDRYW